MTEDKPTTTTAPKVRANTTIVNIPATVQTRSTTAQIGLTGLTSGTPTLTRDGLPVAADERLTLRAGDIALLMQKAAMAEAERILAQTYNAAQARSAAAARRRRPVPMHLRVDASGRSVAPR